MSLDDLAPSARPIDPELDLVVDRVIHAPRSAVWQAWTDPSLLARWWVPSPMTANVLQLDVRPGGVFVTELSENGTDFFPHTDNVFLVVEPEERIVFTNAVNSSWRPALPEPVGITAEIVLAEHPEGTAYRAIARHGSPEQRSRHEELGFYEGWGAVIAALADIAESR